MRASFAERRQAGSGLAGFFERLNAGVLVGLGGFDCVQAGVDESLVRGREVARRLASG